ncbi:ROK family transcriptional regulator [Rhizohabitans arisaemae]|uniref:ROK family transcriptional regulator n=1 Tax=Rhizohabitans arisaemae TaxID=2720610 RepID=UPI0024B0FD89|nr:ROK family transcriptional regulator [Rhizohabitans arisaemae]
MTSGNPLQSTRQLSSQAVVEVLLREAPLSRVQIAKVTGLSKQTVNEIVRQLEAEGWVSKHGMSQGEVGRRAATYSMQPDAGYVIGVDLGATKLRVALSDLGGSTVAQGEVATDRRGGTHLLDQIHTTSVRLAGEVGVGWGRVLSSAIGGPGVFNAATGAMDRAPNVPGLGDMDVAGALRDRLGHEITIDNDVNMAVAGERWRGVAQDCANFAFIALGTGIGMGIFMDGAVRRGANGAAGEIAYAPFADDPFDVSLHEHGPLEEVLSSHGFSASYTALTDEQACPELIFERYGAQQDAARQAVAAYARHIAIVLSTVTAFLDPELIVVGGGIGSRPGLVAEVIPLYRRLAASTAEIRTSALGAQASLVGATAVALGQVHNRLFAAAVPERLPLPVPGPALEPPARSAR